MENGGTYKMDDFYNEVPEEFSKEDDKWFRFFPPKSFGVLVATGVWMVILTKLFGFMHVTWLGFILGGINMLFFTGITMIPVGADDYLKGAGQKLDIILIRRIIRKINRCIYIKGYDSGY